MTDLEHAILDLASKHFRYPGARDSAIVDLGLTPARFHQILGALIERPDVEAHAPQLVHRLRRLREARRAVRSR